MKIHQMLMPYIIMLNKAKNICGYELPQKSFLTQNLPIKKLHKNDS